jgi:thiol:disulfide interchange protein DsbD
MERLKQFMGFPLLATNLWLLWVLQNQRGHGALLILLTLFLILGFCSWLFGTLSKSESRGTAVLRVLILLVAVTAIFVTIQQIRFADPVAETQTPSDHEISWVAYSTEALDSLRAEGKPVLVDFTASWCLTCQFNERTAINVPAVRNLLMQKKITAMKGDWTNADPAITAALKSFGRVGVPLAVFYPTGKGSEPVVLPELLTEKIVLDTLSK